MTDRHKPRKGDRHKPRKGDRHTSRSRRVIPHTERPFICIDGEAVYLNDSEAITDGIQDYCLLASDRGHELYSSTGRLHTDEILSWLFDLDVTDIWLFGGTYDVNNILRDIEHGAVKSLNGSRHSTCRYRQYTIKYLYGKHLTVTRHTWDSNGKKKRVGKTIHLWDFYHYVQCSFVKWLDDWHLIPNKDKAAMELMKDKRDRFTRDMIDDVRQYNQMELRYMHAGIDRFYRLVSASGITPTNWNSPGSLAKALFKQHAVTDYYGDCPEEVTLAAGQSYHGGRFELSRRGMISGPIYIYDIKSAYPYAMTQLPTLQGTWEYIQSPTKRDLSRPGLVKIDWNCPRSRLNFAPYPKKYPQGQLIFPLSSWQASWQNENNWLWSWEILAGWSMIKPHLHEMWAFHPTDDSKPFGFIGDLYVERQRMQREGNEAQKILKLAMNSSYGTTAQGISKPYMRSKYTNEIYASMITSITRTQLLKALEIADSHNVIFMATDSICSTEPLDLDIGDSLGQWECEVHDWILTVQNGIYFLPGSSNAIGKKRSRGIPAKLLDFDTVKQALDDGKDAIDIAMTSRFIGYKTAFNRRKPELWCTRVKERRMLSFSMRPKREPTLMLDGIQYSRPATYADVNMSAVLASELSGLSYGDEDVNSIEQRYIGGDDA